MAYPEAKGKKVMLDRAPYWYGTPLDKLDFEWNKEEEQEIERYCERILKNIADEEEMTPRERFLAQVYAKQGERNADRKLMYCGTMVTYPTRTLDGYADALVPIDLYRSPKLLVKAQFATAARFKEDYISWANITYTEDLWGGRAKMVDYGNPSQVGEPPIKSMKDLEALKGEVPDPYSVGLYPGYLWANRENRRILSKYNIPMPMMTSMCPGATEVAQLGMMGWTPFQVALRRDPELAKAASNLGNEWCKRFGRAIVDVCHPEGIYCCQFTGGFHMKGNEWVADMWADLCQDLKAYSLKHSKSKIPGRPDGTLHLSHGYSFLSGVFEWYEILWDHNAMTPETFDGGWGGFAADIDMNRIFEWHRDHNLFLAASINNTTLEKGPISAIEEEIRASAEYGMQARKFTCGTVPVYFVPPHHLDAAVAAYRKYNRLEFMDRPYKHTGTYPIKDVEKKVKV